MGGTFLPSDDARALRQARHRSGSARTARQLRGQRQLGDSRLTRDEALRMAAQSGHRLTWNEDRYGSLEVGKVADMVVLADDPLSCDLGRLKDIRVDRTFLGGRQVFGPT